MNSFIKTLRGLAFATPIILFAACSGEKAVDTANDDIIPPTTVTETEVAPEAGIEVAPTETAAPTITTSSTGLPVAHYVCPKKCAGSGGDNAGKCPVCGSDYVHNDAFHTQLQNNPATTQPAKAAQPSVNVAPATTPTPQPSPATNATGQFHYICTAGHAGAGLAGNCASCGKELVHNDKYHQ